MLPQLGRSADEVLYWMVDENSVVHQYDGSTTSILDYVPASSDSSLSARVRITGGGIVNDVFLNIYDPPENPYSGDPGVLYAGDLGLEVGSGDIWYGAEMVQAPLTSGSIPSTNPDGEIVGLPTPMPGTPEYSFIIELGNIDWSGENPNWTSIAQSRSYTYNELLTSSYIHETFDLNPPRMGTWNPIDYYAPIPEPSAGILFLIGGTLLMLRRKHGLG